MNRRTCLYDLHVERGARMAPFGGWEMPIQYQGILAEHEHTRRHVAVFDISHMGEFELSGPAAATDLERLLTQRISTLKIGQCRYGYLLKEDGGVLDDLTCYRPGPDRYFLVVNAATCAADAEWIQQHLSPATTFQNRSDELAKLDIQGPTARAEVERVLGEALPDLGYFKAVETTVAGIPMLVSRTGYTGEFGYEWYFPVEAAESLWRKLTADGTIRPAGLGARDTLRLEVGYPLYGHELGPTRTPVAAVGRAFMDPSKDFIGRAAVLHDLEQGTAERLVGLKLDGKRAARAGDAVWQGDQRVGEVTSGSLAPSLGCAIAFAYVQSGCEGPLEIENRQTRLPAEIVVPPFYRLGTARG